MNKDKFDPANHRFGMAYVDIGGSISYPYDIKIYPSDTRVGLYNPPNQKSSFGWEITRAPEHDLIPKAKADGLLEAAKVLTLACGNMGIEGTFTDNMIDQIKKYEATNE